jgi:putative component of membrane protein insertase Oxa1/YidC/SpoIIIJ protein YidD
MGQLWQRVQRPLKRPRTWLLFYGALAGLAVLDSFRSPPAQVTGWAYVCAVRAYQVVGRPVLRGRVQCRYCPSCSDYSIGAVRAHGIRRGLVLTWNRVSSCQNSVPLGTPDPVPPPEDR